MTSRDNSRPSEAVQVGTPDPGAIQSKVSELRSAEFTGSRRGFDRDEVTAYLHGLADWLESTGLADPDQVRRELSLVGERTSEILTKVEDTAREIRSEAQRNAAETLDSAREEGEAVRGEAAEEARRARIEAEELVDDAERRTEQMITETLRRRQALETVIEDLLDRRNQIVADANRLVVELSELLEAEQEEELGESAELAEDEPEFDDEGELPAVGDAVEEADDELVAESDDRPAGDELDAGELETGEQAARTSPGAP